MKLFYNMNKNKDEGVKEGGGGRTGDLGGMVVYVV
jgi:hypothetical protein